MTNKALLFLLLLLTGTSCYATNERPFINIVTEEAYPMNYTDSRNNNITGLATDYLRTALDFDQYNYRIEIMPWARAYKIAQ